MTCKNIEQRLNWKRRILLAVLPKLLYYIMKIYFFTCRVTCVGKEKEDLFIKQNKPILFVSWHQAILYGIYHFRYRRGIIMASKSKDGELIARLGKLLGFGSARGSSSRDGKKAMRVMIDEINRTHCYGGLVADGPRGPACVAKMGIIKIAKETELPIIPVMYWASKKILLNNWDKTIIPMPFSKIIFHYSDAIFVPKDATSQMMEEKRIFLTNKMNEMNQAVQKHFDKNLKCGTTIS